MTITIKELKKEVGGTLKNMAEKFDIPYNSIQNWHSEKRDAPGYVIGMMSKIYELERTLKYARPMYSIVKIEIELKRTDEIKEGCTITAKDDYAPERIVTYGLKKDAEKHLAGLKSTVRRVGDVYIITEYAIEEWWADQEEEFIEGSNFDFAEFEEK